MEVKDKLFLDSSKLNKEWPLEVGFETRSRFILFLMKNPGNYTSTEKIDESPRLFTAICQIKRATLRSNSEPFSILAEGNVTANLSEFKGKQAS